MKTPALRFSVEGKYFKNGAFGKRCFHDNHVISQPEFSSNKPRITGDRDGFSFKFLRRNTDGKHLMHFQIENFVFRCSPASCGRDLSCSISQSFAELTPGDRNFSSVVSFRSEKSEMSRFLVIETFM